jgi:hypothetical protein
MTFTRSLKYLIVVAIITVAIHNNANAGGFPVRPGRLIISPSVSYFFATKEWDADGNKESFPDNGKYTSETLSLYAEYGISRRFSAVATLPYSFNHFSSSNTPTVNYSGLTDLETGIKYYLANINYIYYISVQGTAITPLYTNPPSGTGSELGYDEEGAELKVSFAGSGTLFNKNVYFDADEAVRQYFGDQGPIQDRYQVTGGITLDKAFKNQLSLTFGGIWSESNYKNFNIINPEQSKNFAFKQLTLSYGHSFSRRFSSFLSVGKFLTGRNTGDGTSVSLAVAYRLFN